MRTAKRDPGAANRHPAFAVWITGLPASGKSTIAERLVGKLRARGVDCARLESDALRTVLHGLDYSGSGRDSFYATIAWVAKLLTEHGVSVVIDATANRRRYRDAARQATDHFIEVYVDTPLEVCMERDPKGVYRKAGTDPSNDVPGLGAEYERPRDPDVTVSGVGADPGDAADRIVSVLVGRDAVPKSRS